MGQLGEQIARVDQARFAGRERELALLDGILGDDGRVSVVFVHGPGGIGKSTLLREAARRAAASDYTAFAVDGRELAPAPGDLERALAGVERAERPLILLDSYERVAALGSYLRTQLLPRLPAATRVMIGGRTPPEEGWHQNGWDAVTLALALPPLSADESQALLRSCGLDDPLALQEVVAWAGGSPLALALAAEASAVAGTAAQLTNLDEDGALGGELVRRVVGDELDGADLDVVAVATVAHSVDARLLGDVLPGVDGDHAIAWLRSLSFAEALGTGVTLHDRVRRSLRGELRASDPSRDRDLRRRVADHLHERGRAGEAGRVLQFGELVHDPALRFGFGVGAGRTQSADRVRPGDLEVAGSALGASREDWWRGLGRWFSEEPGSVMAVRDAGGSLTGFGIFTTLADAPDWADEDPVIAPLIALARTEGDEEALIRRDMYDLAAGREGDALSPSLALLNAAFALRADLSATRRQYCVTDALDGASIEFNRAAGIARLADLDGVVEGRALIYHLLDHGPGGIMETSRALVYRDLGLAPPPPTPDTEAIDAAAVRDALRAFNDPLLLARSPLARGITVADRAASVRSLLGEAAAAEFGSSSAEQLLRATLERGYMDPDGGHEAAALALNVSRATYFRRLSPAVERLTARVLQG